MKGKPVNPIRALIAVDGATVHIHDFQKLPYCDVIVQDDYLVVRTEPAKKQALFEPHVHDLMAGLQSWVNARHMAITEPAKLVAVYFGALATNANRAKYPKRGDKTK